LGNKTNLALSSSCNPESDINRQEHLEILSRILLKITSIIFTPLPYHHTGEFVIYLDIKWEVHRQYNIDFLIYLKMYNLITNSVDNSPMANRRYIVCIPPQSNVRLTVPTQQGFFKVSYMTMMYQNLNILMMIIMISLQLFWLTSRWVVEKTRKKEKTCVVSVAVFRINKFRIKYWDVNSPIKIITVQFELVIVLLFTSLI
jgi:hypothetical protein